VVLDQVDLSRQIRGNLEADFLLANRGLHPGLHGASPWVGGGILPARLYNGNSTPRDATPANRIFHDGL
jgi:hypothetical protein